MRGEGPPPPIGLNTGDPSGGATNRRSGPQTSCPGSRTEPTHEGPKTGSPGGRDCRSRSPLRPCTSSGSPINGNRWPYLCACILHTLPLNSVEARASGNGERPRRGVLPHGWGGILTNFIGARRCVNPRLLDNEARDMVKHRVVSAAEAAGYSAQYVPDNVNDLNRTNSLSARHARFGDQRMEPFFSPAPLGRLNSHPVWIVSNWECL
jgi:hypothetical protein